MSPRWACAVATALVAAAVRGADAVTSVTAAGSPAPGTAFDYTSSADLAKLAADTNGGCDFMENYEWEVRYFGVYLVLIRGGPAALGRGGLTPCAHHTGHFLLPDAQLHALASVHARP